VLAGVPLRRRAVERAPQPDAAVRPTVHHLDDTPSSAAEVRVAVAANAIDDERVRLSPPTSGAAPLHPRRRLVATDRLRCLDQDDTASPLLATNAVTSASDSNPTTAHA
jgi:hypothetical protein